MTKKVLVMFYNSSGYDSHSVIKEIDKFDVNVSVIPNELQKYMAFTISKNLLFIDSLQFMNAKVDELVKNFSKMGFKYLSQELSDKQLKLVKQTGVCPYEYIKGFK